jgi:hypothetical protein
MARTPTLGDIVLVDTPGRPLGDAVTNPGIICKVVDDNRISATVFPAAGGAVAVRIDGLVNEDTISRAEQPMTQTWRFKPPIIE